MSTLVRIQDLPPRNTRSGRRPKDFRACSGSGPQDRRRSLHCAVPAGDPAGLSPRSGRGACATANTRRSFQARRTTAGVGVCASRTHPRRRWPRPWPPATPTISSRGTSPNSCLVYWSALASPRPAAARLSGRSAPRCRGHRDVLDASHQVRARALTEGENSAGVGVVRPVHTADLCWSAAECMDRGGRPYLLILRSQVR